MPAAQRPRPGRADGRQRWAGQLRRARPPRTPAGTRGVGAGRCPVGDVDAREAVGPGTGDAVDREPALRGIELPDAGDRLHDGPRALEAGATVEGTRLKNTPSRVRMSVPIQTTFTTPALSVRIAQPWRPPVWLLFVAAGRSPTRTHRPRRGAAAIAGTDSPRSSASIRLWRPAIAAARRLRGAQKWPERRRRRGRPSGSTANR
jgi:hypothetical protein